MTVWVRVVWHSLTTCENRMVQTMLGWSATVYLLSSMPVLKTMDPSTHRNLFPIRHFVRTRLVTRKLQEVYGRSTYLTTAILSEMSIFCVRAGCGMRLASYGFKLSLCGLELHASLFGARATTHDNKTHVPYDCILHTKRRLY